MNVIVNNKTVELPDAAGINALLAQLNITSPQGIAIAINEQVLPKSEWESCTLKNNDAVLLIRATQGG
ncbi:sulfur carrier protein ThiS [Cytophaga hutchinsonii]|uniref:Sulfur carrier protein ThiS n=1 Tax=Cytophaga hutchinsonii (strain ATCC 33406 / DSM 1761 / CIP 103989 / NBRC 15051 / NCIMB 9469 / D465) TaxID=269798 RepID=A0A6N4SMN6_CYTH3|nr:sulfur carrier protein ThiS [Cytophaga hutchinsonii]ABG57531.1 sulfur carrier protein ThiS [Cytophaga hutchinsonii ATCC 33406]SFW99325.1 sulfur carrier protein ThiS [Cytophaga hutchinsonii ATCC 33406]